MGDTITYTVTLIDDGPDAATGVTVTDLLPAGLTFVSATPSQGTYDPATGLWTVGTVNAGPRRPSPSRRRVAAQPSDQHRDHQSRRPVRPQPEQHHERHRDATARRPGAAQDRHRRHPQRGRHDHLHRHARQQRTVHRHQRRGHRPPPGRADLRLGHAQPGDLRPAHRPMDHRHRPTDHRNAHHPRQRRLPQPQTNTASIATPTSSTPTPPTTRPPPPRPRSRPTWRSPRRSPTPPPTWATRSPTPSRHQPRPRRRHQRQVTDLLPPGLTFVSATPTQGTYDSVTGLWTVGTVTTAGTADAHHTATVVDAAGDQYGDDHPCRPVRPRSRPTTRRCPGGRRRADLEVVQDGDDPTPNVGDTITFTVTLRTTARTRPPTSRCPTAPRRADLRLGLPARGRTTHHRHLDRRHRDHHGAAADPPADRSSTAPTRRPTPRPSPTPTSSTPIPPTTRQRHSRRRSRPTWPSPRPSAPDPNVGDIVTFIVTLTDNGPDTATNVRATDLLPAGLTFVSASPSQGTYDPATAAGPSAR